MAELLKLKMNVPEVIALQFATGKIVESTIPNAPNQVLFTLCDGRRTFLPLSAADRIREAGIQAMQQFEILKASANDFRVRPIGAGSAVSAAPPANAQQTSAAESATPPNGNRNNGSALPPQTAPPAPPAPGQGRQKMSLNSLRWMAAYKEATDILVEEKAYALSRGLAVEIRCEDIRCLVAAMMIDKSKGGGQ
jgi:hypothetical protein